MKKKGRRGTEREREQERKVTAACYIKKHEMVKKM
jgi:hypothetical protein